MATQDLAERSSELVLTQPREGGLSPIQTPRPHKAGGTPALPVKTRPSTTTAQMPMMRCGFVPARMPRILPSQIADVDSSFAQLQLALATYPRVGVEGTDEDLADAPLDDSRGARELGIIPGSARLQSREQRCPG